jgi:hypothetical protein
MRARTHLDAPAQAEWLKGIDGNPTLNYPLVRRGTPVLFRPPKVWL